jgi:hypothetical protein
MNKDFLYFEEYEKKTKARGNTSYNTLKITLVLQNTSKDYFRQTGTSASFD